MTARRDFSRRAFSMRGFLFAAWASHVALFIFAIVLVVALGVTSGMSRYLYLMVDIPSYLSVFVALLFSCFMFRLLPNVDFLWKLSPLHVALAIVVLTMAGTHFAHHSFAFSMDEWMQRLQANIFSHGRLSGVLPEEWRPQGRAMFHSFAQVDTLTGQVASNYRPGMAATIALFDQVNMGLYVSAFASAGAVILVASITKSVLPTSKNAPILASFLMASSSQVLAMGLTSYAMPTQLFLNLLWLRLFLCSRPWTHCAAALIGVYSASLHQVHIHLFFAIPFLYLLIRPLKVSSLVIYGTIYSLGHFAIIVWNPIAAPMDEMFIGGFATEAVAEISEDAKTLFALPSLVSIGTIIANLVRYLSWQSLALLPLLLVTMKCLPLTKLNLAMLGSVVLSLLPYVFLMPDQGHGWGYRYLHGSTGSIILLAVFGWAALKDPAKVALASLSGWLVITSLVIVVPFRAFLMEATMTPWVSGAEIVKNADADIVIVDSLRVSYGQDLARTDPFASVRPIAMILHKMTPEQVSSLCATYRVAYFGPNSAISVGIPVNSYVLEEFQDLYHALQQVLQSSICRDVKELIPSRN